MDEDIPYRNDGEWFAKPTVQEQEASDEQTKLNQAKPLVRDVVRRLTERIEFYSRIDSLEVDLLLEPVVLQQQMAANKLVRDILSTEKEYILSLIK